MERLWIQKGGQCIKNQDFIVWPPGTAKVGCKRTKIDWLSILEGEVNSCCYKLLTFVWFDWITCQKICKYTPMLPFLTDLVWVWVKMSVKLPNSCWLTDAALTLQSLLSSGATHTTKSVIFQVLKWTGNSRWRWPWNQSPGLKNGHLQTNGWHRNDNLHCCAATPRRLMINDKLVPPPNLTNPAISKPEAF